MIRRKTVNVDRDKQIRIAGRRFPEMLLRSKPSEDPSRDAGSARVPHCFRNRATGSETVVSHWTCFERRPGSYRELYRLWRRRNLIVMWRNRRETEWERNRFPFGTLFFRTTADCVTSVTFPRTLERVLEEGKNNNGVIKGWIRKKSLLSSCNTETSLCGRVLFFFFYSIFLPGILVVTFQHRQLFGRQIST